MRPDRTVQADMSASSFPSLSSAPVTAASQPKLAGWQNTSPDGKGKPHSTDSMHSPPQTQRQKAQYAAAVSPQIAQQAKHADSNSRDSMALSDAELAAITQLLSLHQWAEPGLVRVSRSCNIFFFFLRHLRCICARNLQDTCRLRALRYSCQSQNDRAQSTSGTYKPAVWYTFCICVQLDTASLPTNDVT